MSISFKTSELIESDPKVINYLEYFKDSVSIPQTTMRKNVTRVPSNYLLTDEFVSLYDPLMAETVFGGHMNLYMLMNGQLSKCVCPFFTHVVSGKI